MAASLLAVAESRRLVFALIALVTVAAAGTVGYIALGFGVLDAVYQTVTTVTTVGFREVHPLSTAGKIFTIVLIVLGVGTALYTLGVIIETLLEGQLPEVFGRRRMERRIRGMKNHVVVCGWGVSARRSLVTSLRWAPRRWWWTTSRAVSRGSPIPSCSATPPTTTCSNGPASGERGRSSPLSIPTQAT